MSACQINLIYLRRGISQINLTTNFHQCETVFLSSEFLNRWHTQRGILELVDGHFWRLLVIGIRPIILSTTMDGHRSYVSGIRQVITVIPIFRTTFSVISTIGHSVFGILNSLGATRFWCGNKRTLHHESHLTCLVNGISYPELQWQSYEKLMNLVRRIRYVRLWESPLRTALNSSVLEFQVFNSKPMLTFDLRLIPSWKMIRCTPLFSNRCLYYQNPDDFWDRKEYVYQITIETWMKTLSDTWCSCVRFASSCSRQHLVNSKSLQFCSSLRCAGPSPAGRFTVSVNHNDCRTFQDTGHGRSDSRFLRIFSIDVIHRQK